MFLFDSFINLSRQFPQDGRQLHYLHYFNATITQEKRSEKEIETSKALLEISPQDFSSFDLL